MYSRERDMKKEVAFMKVIQISDFHLRGDGKLSFQKADTMKALHQTIDYFCSMKDYELPEFFVVTGDLSEGGTREECETQTIEQEIDFINNCNSSDAQAMIVCEVGGKLAGNCMVWWNNRVKTGHRASVAIGLLSEFWNQGIGTRMFQEMIKIAENNPKILQMELDFIEGNSRARALYEKMGFRITGINFNAIRQKDGTLCNEYSMIREINR